MNTQLDTPISENKAVITVVGKDAVGIIAGVTTHLADRKVNVLTISQTCLLYTSPSPRDRQKSRMPSSA